MQPPYIQTGLSFGLRLSLLGAVYIAFAIWVKLALGNAPLGLRRLGLSAPILFVNLVSPWLFSLDDELLTRLTSVFVFSWLCTFKVLAFCLGRAPLREDMTVPQIATVMMLPIFPQPPQRAKTGPEGRLHDSAGPGWLLAGRWLGKIAMLGSIAYAILTYGDTMPAVLRHYMHALGLYAFVGFLMDGPAAVAVEALGLQLVPTFDEPWMSSSLADWWGRRWNITTASVLRVLVYDIIADGSLINPRRMAAAAVTAPEGRVAGEPAGPASAAKRKDAGASLSAADAEVKKDEQQKHAPSQAQQGQQGAVGGRRKPSMLRRQIGLHATFLVSGIIHEYILWSVSGTGQWGWKWTLYFYIQAPLMTAEGYLGGLMQRAGVRLPLLLRMALTHAVIERLSGALFLYPVEVESDLAARVIRATTQNYGSMLAPLAPLLGQVREQMAPLLGPLMAAAAAPFGGGK